MLPKSTYHYKTLNLLYNLLDAKTKRDKTIFIIDRLVKRMERVGIKLFSRRYDMLKIMLQRK